MWGGFAWAQGAWASQPQYGSSVPGVVWGGDYTLDVVYGGDSGVQSSGYAFGGDQAMSKAFGEDSKTESGGTVYGGDETGDVVFGGDERAG